MERKSDSTAPPTRAGSRPGRISHRKWHHGLKPSICAVQQDNKPTPTGKTMQRFAQEARTICRRAGIASEKVRETESDLIRYFVKNWRLEYVKTSEEEAAEIVLQNAP